MDSFFNEIQKNSKNVKSLSDRNIDYNSRKNRNKKIVDKNQIFLKF